MLNIRTLPFVAALLAGLLLISDAAVRAQAPENNSGVSDLSGKTIEVTFQDFMSEGPYEVR